MIRPLAGQRALVTGASGGVGRALAIALARAGASSVVVARRESPLQQTAQLAASSGEVRCLTAVGDISLKQDRKAALDLCQSELGGLDLLINNAGIGAEGRFAEASPERLRQIMEVNFFAAIELAREALPMLQQSPSGCIACVGSVLAWCGAPQKSEYTASKYALRGWCDAVRPEFRRQGVHVLHASPSTIASDFRRHRVEAAADSPWPAREGVSPERVAQRIVRGVERRSDEVAITWEDWAIVRAARYLPRVLNLLLKKYG